MFQNCGFFVFGAFFEEFGELDVFGPANFDEGVGELDDFVNARDELAVWLGAAWWLVLLRV